MKKILSIIAVSLGLLSFWLVVNNVYAEWTIDVKVTEKIPGAECTASGWWYNADGTKKTSGTADDTVTEYTCKIKKGFRQITDMLWNIIKYFTFLAGLWGVLFIVINGILYSMGWIDSGWKDEAKKRIVKTLIGLTILLLSWVILNIVAPWIYTF